MKMERGRRGTVDIFQKRKMNLADKAIGIRFKEGAVKSSISHYVLTYCVQGIV